MRVFYLKGENNMAIPVWLNLTATATEANVVKTIYGVKLFWSCGVFGIYADTLIRHISKSYIFAHSFLAQA